MVTRPARAMLRPMALPSRFTSGPPQSQGGSTVSCSMACSKSLGALADFAAHATAARAADPLRLPIVRRGAPSCAPRASNSLSARRTRSLTVWPSRKSRSASTICSPVGHGDMVEADNDVAGLQPGLFGAEAGQQFLDLWGRAAEVELDADERARGTYPPRQGADDADRLGGLGDAGSDRPLPLGYLAPWPIGPALGPGHARARAPRRPPRQWRSLPPPPLSRRRASRSACPS